MDVVKRLLLIKRLAFLPLLWGGLAVCLMSVHSVRAEDARLNDLQQEIKHRQATISERKAKIEAAQQQLKKTEVAVGKAATALQTTHRAIKDIRQQQRELTQQQHELEQQQHTQRQVLATQLRSAYQSGEHSYLQMLLEQQSAKRLERVLTYYDYFNKARVESIEALIASGKKLVEVRDKLSATLAKQQQLKDRQQQQVAELRDKQQQQQHAVGHLRTLLRDDQSALAQLEDSRKQLKSLIERKGQPAQPSMQGLAKGHLSWPLKGKVLHHYGSVRQGRIHWRGLVINGELGDNVKAVASGQVLYADWLKGLGLVMVVDHGHGYLSIYGHAQALLKQSGDAVSAGEVIALAGRSGGADETGLYFELRHNDKSMNPERWLP